MHNTHIIVRAMLIHVYTLMECPSAWCKNKTCPKNFCRDNSCSSVVKETLINLVSRETREFKANQVILIPPSFLHVNLLSLMVCFLFPPTGKWHIGTHCENNDNNSCQDPIGQGFDSFYGVPLTNLRDCRGDSNVFVAWDEHIYRDILITYAFLLWGAYALKKRNIVGRPGFLILFTIASLLCGGFYAFIQGIKMMNCLILDDREVIEQPLTYDRLADRMTQRAIKFMEQDHDGRPFMLTMSFLQAHTALFSSDKFTNHSKHGPYGDTVEEMDDSLGEIMAAIKTLGFDDNTFVYLTSDNGGHVEEHTEDLVREGGWNGIYKGMHHLTYCCWKRF